MSAVDPYKLEILPGARPPNTEKQIAMIALNPGSDLLLCQFGDLIVVQDSLDRPQFLRSRNSLVDVHVVGLQSLEMVLTIFTQQHTAVLAGCSAFYPQQIGV